MTKAALKNMFLDYISNPNDGYKMKNGRSWETVIPLFCEPNLTDSERWETWLNHVELSRKRCNVKAAA